MFIKERLKNLSPGGDLFYSIVSIVALLISVVLLGVVIFSDRSSIPTHDPYRLNGKAPVIENAATDNTPEVQGNAATAIEITNEQASKLISSLIPESFPVKDIEVTFLENYMHVKGTALRNAFAVYLGDDLENLPNLFKSALSIVPESVEVSLDFDLSSSETSPFIITPRSISVGSITFNASILPERFISTVTESINAVISRYGSVFSKVEASDGLLKLYP